MKKIIRYVLISSAALVLIFVLSAVICASAFFIYAEKNIDKSLDFETLMSAKGLTSTICYIDDSGNEVELKSLHGIENRIWADIESVPSHVIDAFVSIEDHRFFEHNGIDVTRTIGAIVNFSKDGSYGGSTITQQLVKNLTGEDQITVNRKIKEIFRALELEKSVSKTDILEAYLNTVYLSNGCYGIRTAAEYFFGKDVSKLTLQEGAALAAIIKYPYKYDPIKFPKENVKRRNIVLMRMYELGKISEDEYESSIETSLDLNVNEKKRENGHLSWFEETVIDEVAASLCEKYGYDASQAIKMIYGGGLKIVSTISPELQSALESIYENDMNFPTSGILSAPQSSAVIIDPETGELLAIAGARGKKTSDRILNYATRLTRSPGSVLKPLSVYAQAIDKDIVTWSSVYDDVPVSFEQIDDEWIPWPKNNPRVYSGLTNINHSLEKSINTVAVKVLREVGLKESFDFLKKLDISTLVEQMSDKDGKRLSDIGDAPLALGATTNGCTLYEITGAYTTLACGGVFNRAHSFSRVYDSKGKVLVDNEIKGERMISEESADIMTRMLENVVKSGTAKGMKISETVSVAGKTGTSNANTDRWFIGYTPDYICGVWYGYTDARDIGYYRNNPACSIFDEVMRKIYAVTPELADNKFVRSENVVPCLYCRDSGKLPCGDCIYDPRGTRIELGYFKKGTEPQDHCDTHICVDYDEEHGVICDICSGKESKKAALVKNYGRLFPHQVIISDAQYTYRYLSPFTSPSENENEAYFDVLRKEGEYFGTSGVDKAFNRAYIKKENDELIKEYE